MRPEFDSSDVAFNTLLTADASVATSSRTETRVFEAEVFVATAADQLPAWGSFLSSAFTDLFIPSGVHPSAILFVRAKGTKAHEPATYAFTFGPAGRFMLDPAVYVRGYGLKTALNMIYPKRSKDAPRLRSVDSKRRDASILRSRVQASGQVDFEAFEVSQLRDVLDKAVGQPYDSKWGQRVQGGDSLTLSLPVVFKDLGRICRDLERVSKRADYRSKFAWIDNIQPLADPVLKKEIEDEVIRRVREARFEGISLAPPEVLDWTSIAGFRYHFDRSDARGGVQHPDIRIEDYVRGLKRSGRLTSVDADSLGRWSIFAYSQQGDPVASWPAWKCLVAEILFNGETYILDEGDIFRISGDYMEALDDFLSTVPMSSWELPDTIITESEGDYNENAAKASDLLLLDKKNVISVPGRTTAIEVCDLLSSDRHLIHVKRHLSSSTLSHLFAQGLVSAELLQSSPDFLHAVVAKVSSTSKGKVSFAPMFSAGVQPGEWKVVYGVAAEWNGKGLEERLPFFSKVNLREAYTNLTSRGFIVEFAQIDAIRAVSTASP